MSRGLMLTDQRPRSEKKFSNETKALQHARARLIARISQGEVSLDVTGVPPGKYDLVLESEGILEATTPVEVLPTPDPLFVSVHVEHLVSPCI